MKTRASRHGFTLIELLVVIAIIAILAAILFPVFAKSKERANMVKCLNNLHHLATAMSLYADANNGRLPNARVCERRPSWEGSEGVSQNVDLRRSQIFAYVKNESMYMCPIDRKVIAKNVEATWAKTYPLSYSMNFKLSWKIVSTLYRPSKMLLLVHESRSSINDGDFNWASDLDRQSAVHYDGTTLVYADGHSVWQSFNQLEQARTAGDWDPDRRH